MPHPLYSEPDYDRPLVECRPGDLVHCFGHARAAALVGEVLKVCRVNVKVKSTVRFRPDGPWFESVHFVPKREVNRVLGRAA